MIKCNNKNYFRYYKIMNMFLYFFDFNIKSHLIFENNVTMINNAHK